MCPPPNACLALVVIYHSLVLSEMEAWNYFGYISQTFKKRWESHKSNMKNKGHADAVGQSVRADADGNYRIKKSVMKKCHPYKKGNSVCDM